MQDGGSLGRDDHPGQQQRFEVAVCGAGATGDRLGQCPLAGRLGLQVLAVQRRLGRHQGAESVQPALGQPFLALRPVEAGDDLDQGVGERLARRALGQIGGQPGASQGGRPDDRRLLAREVVVERPGRHPDGLGDLRDPHLGQALRLGQLERGQRQVEAGLLLLQVPAAHRRRSRSGGCVLMASPYHHLARYALNSF